MNEARHRVDFERTIAPRPFVRKKPRTDWLHHPEPPKRILIERKCPPCDGLCDELEHCPRHDNLPASKGNTLHFWTGLTFCLSVLAAIVAIVAP